MKYLPNKKDYPYLAEYLRAGGKMAIGENSQMGSFAHIRIENKIRTVDTMQYKDFSKILKEMDLLAKAHIKKNW